MRTVLAAVGAALIVIFTLATNLFILASDWVSAGFFLTLTFICAILLWVVTDTSQEG